MLKHKKTPKNTKKTKTRKKNMQAYVEQLIENHLLHVQVMQAKTHRFCEN